MTWIGLALWCVVTWDLLMVTLGAAWNFSVSARLGKAVFAILRRVARLGGRSVISELAGVVVMTATAGFWIVGYWAAWTLVYAGADKAIEVTRTGQEPEGIDLIAHTGHLLSTLGGATTTPASALWDGVGALVGLNGMLALTLSVSFLLAVRGTVQQGRALAHLVATGPADASALDGRVADLVSGLHSAPMGLWFGHRVPERRLTSALLAYARQAEREGPEPWARARALLADLPYLDADPSDEGFMRDLEGWVHRHEVQTTPSAR